jgi:virulence factor Mce-like protein
MTRTRWVVALVLVAAAGALVALVAPSQGTAKYRVDVVFDDSRGLVPGQLVQVAGARVGKITDVSLTREFRARVHMEVDEKFAPFREDATCTIKPQGLIAENYVQCDPGTPDAKPLRARGDGAPTVAVERTTQPVSLTDLFEIWNAPTRDRLRVLFNTLGIANAARGEDLNAMLRRFNPTLQQARETIGMLERQRDDLAQMVDATGEAAEGLARRPERLTEVVRRTGRVTARTAQRRGALAEGVRRLPGLLAEATPALRKLDATMDAGRPLFEALTAAAPGLNRVSSDIPRLSEVAKPALRRLGPVLRDGADTARRSAPLIRLVAQTAAASLPSAKTAGVLFPTLEERGFARDFIAFNYNGAMAAARYDETSHILPAHVLPSICSQYATVPEPACGATRSAPEQRSEPRRKKRSTKKRSRTREERREQAREAPRGSEPAPAAPRVPELPKLPELPRLPELPKTPKPKLPELPKLPDNLPLPKTGDEKPDTDVEGLLEFLLG